MVLTDLQAKKVSNGSKYTQMHQDFSSTKPLNPEKVSPSVHAFLTH